MPSGNKDWKIKSGPSNVFLKSFLKNPPEKATSVKVCPRNIRPSSLSYF